MTTQELLRGAQGARGALQCAGEKQKNDALEAIARRLWEDRAAILAENKKDLRRPRVLFPR